MPPFFRSASEVSESEDTSESGSLEVSRHNQASRLNGNEQATSLAFGASIANQHHQNVLLHALLEDKCLNDVCRELSNSGRRRSRDDPEVRIRATERYRVLTGQLVSHGLVTAGPEQERHDHIRRTAIDGLTLLSQQLQALDLPGDDASPPSRSRHLIRQPMRRMMSDDIIQDAHEVNPSPGRRLPRHAHDLGAASQLLPSHPLLDSTRYARDFQEVGMLGKGGYGSVFHANHRLDGRSYAVKKIALGPAALLRVQKRGEAELNEILLELRTLARLEHVNIVRYFGGWIEWSKANDREPTTVVSQQRLITEGISQTGGASQSIVNSTESSLMFRSQSAALADSGGSGIIFEDSGPEDTQHQVLNAASVPSTDSRTQSRSTAITVADDDVEAIERDSEVVNDSTHSERVLPPVNATPHLTLHIQMSLYPLTLAQYLSATDIELEGTQLRLQHCFHLDAAANLMIAILDGVDYLHQNDIVHRDLKPANIFLSPRHYPHSSYVPHGMVDPFACRSCRSIHGTAPQARRTRCLRMGVCVGDFGLATMLRRAESAPDVGASSSSAGPSTAVVASSLQRQEHQRQVANHVGTLLYRPPTAAVSPHEGADIFALGVIFVELLIRFGTRMERVVALSGLKDDVIPELGIDVEILIRDMLASVNGSREGALSCAEVRKRLAGLLS